MRPTLRCLVEDIGVSIEPAELRVDAVAIVARQADDPNFLLSLPLPDLVHPLLDRANHLTDPAAELEPIQKIAGGRVYKVKTGVHRGALYQDRDGTWWLLAGGIRKDDGPGDFYEELSSDFDVLAPTTADRRYRALGDAFRRVCEDEKAAQRSLVGALIDAASRPGEWVQVEIFGASLSVRFDDDESDLAVLEVSWELKRFEEQDRFPADVLAMVPGLADVGNWHFWQGSGKEPTDGYQALVPTAWMRDLAVAAEIDELLPDPQSWTPPTPTTDGSENFSHYSGRRTVTMAYVEGVEIVGFCGARVVAHRDYAAFPVCPACQAAVALLRATGHG